MNQGERERERENRVEQSRELEGGGKKEEGGRLSLQLGTAMVIQCGFFVCVCEVSVYKV